MIYRKNPILCQWEKEWIIEISGSAGINWRDRIVLRMFLAGGQVSKIATFIGRSRARVSQILYKDFFKIEHIERLKWPLYPDVHIVSTIRRLDE